MCVHVFVSVCVCSSGAGSAEDSDLLSINADIDDGRAVTVLDFFLPR